MRLTPDANAQQSASRRPRRRTCARSTSSGTAPTSTSGSCWRCTAASRPSSRPSPGTRRIPCRASRCLSLTINWCLRHAGWRQSARRCAPARMWSSPLPPSACATWSVSASSSWLQRREAQVGVNYSGFDVDICLCFQANAPRTPQHRTAQHNRTRSAAEQKVARPRADMHLSRHGAEHELRSLRRSARRAARCAHRTAQQPVSNQKNKQQLFAAKN